MKPHGGFGGPTQQGGFGGPKRWEGKPNNGFAGKMKGSETLNRNKPTRFSPLGGKPTQPNTNTFGGFGQRMARDNKFNVPPPTTPSNGEWGNQSNATNSAPKPNKPSVNVKEMCNVQGMNSGNSYDYQAFLNAFGYAQMQTVQQ
jgi:hypothetical protein